MISPESIVEEFSTLSRLNGTDMKALISQVQPLFKSEKNLLKASRKSALVVGDLHGDFGAALHVVTLWKKRNFDFLIFLGDYVDRGDQQMETINWLLALKLLYPERVFLLRGNHETPFINSSYGFLSVCIKKFGKKAGEIYDEYNNLFSYFSPAFLLGRVLLLHGGIPKGLKTLEELNALPKGDLDADNEILGQILWNDPSEAHECFEPNWSRGIHYTFGKKVFLEFLKNHDIKMVIRGHEVFLEGFKYFFDKKLLSLFSSPHYRMDNEAKAAEISESGEVSLAEVESSQNFTAVKRF